MARKTLRVCLLESWWTAEEIQNRRCDDGTHAHIFRHGTDGADDLVVRGEAEWILDDRIVRRLKIRKNIRGLSARFDRTHINLGKDDEKARGAENGPSASIRLGRREERLGLPPKHNWALAMEAQMRPHRKKNSKTKLLPGPRERMKVLEPGNGAQSKL